MNWDLDSSKEDLVRAITAVADGRCPDCGAALGEFGFCPGCGSRWEWGCAEGDLEPWLEYRSPDRRLDVFWYPFVTATGGR